MNEFKYINKCRKLIHKDLKVATIYIIVKKLHAHMVENKLIIKHKAYTKVSSSHKSSKCHVFQFVSFQTNIRNKSANISANKKPII